MTDLERSEDRRANAVILYEPEAYTRTSSLLKGRQVAGHGFLQGFARYAQVAEFVASVADTKAAALFAAAVRAAGRTEPCRTIPLHHPSSLAAVGCLYRPDPVIGLHAWARAALGHTAWSLCGITHTTASHAVMEAMTDWLVAPVQSWDAVICTSVAVRQMVTEVWGAQSEYLRERFGAQRVVAPQWPVIPLGVAVDELVCREGERAAARAALGVSAQSVVILFVGRLSFHAKAHPLAMYQVLESACVGVETVLIECGWYANEAVADAYAQAVHAACPSVRRVVIDGRELQATRQAWAAADIFCSLADNLQETFGLTPVEAMARGLPVVVSDWDGYRDTVRDGVDGFRVPTVMPGPGAGGDLAQRYALGFDSYDRYCGFTSQLIAVDIEAAATALRRLMLSAPLRQQMGAAGATRARAVFDWSVIVPRYQDLWAELASRRQHAAPPVPQADPWPARMDPFAAFAAYPTQTLTPLTRLRRPRADASDVLARWRGLAMVAFAEPILPSTDECRAVLDRFDQTPVWAAGHLVEGFAEDRQAVIFRGLTWMIKMGALAIAGGGLER
ncbi:MAG: glycosyltransferase family 4 protein [Acidiferrobacter sp.]